MLEMCKEILTKVSFDKLLFQKELVKSLKWIKSDEIDGFKEWCIAKFGNLYPDVLRFAFNKA
ncbi:MAG: hypothetical protein HUJ25_02430 [Crocinitomicaceae bacterium]|nr:hypothetical protein [Crocinitomicaceae bacterium]